MPTSAIGRTATALEHIVRGRVDNGYSRGIVAGGAEALHEDRLTFVAFLALVPSQPGE